MSAGAAASAAQTADKAHYTNLAQPMIPALAELAQLDQWVISKLVNGQKPPFSPHTRCKCSHSNPDDWSSYQAARSELRGFSWLGFVFHESDPYSGIDLDGCRDKATGDIAPWAQRWIDALNSYTEVSPSEEGVKIWVRGTLPEQLTHPLGAHTGIEVYSTKRFFTVTGQHLKGTPDDIRNAQPVLDLMWAEYHKAIEPAAPRAPKQSPCKRAAALTIPDVLTVLLADGAIQTSPKDLSCPYCNHTHKNTLFIFKGRVYSRSPGCVIPQTGGLDTVGLHAVVDYGSNTEANRTAVLKARYPLPARPANRTNREDTRHTATAQPAQPAPVYRTEAQANYNARRRAQRQQEAQKALAQWRAHLGTLDLPDRAHIVGDYLHELSAGKHLQVNPTNAQIVAARGLSERTVQYAFRDLESAGLGKRSGGRQGSGDQPNECAVWTFSRAIPRVQRETAQIEDYVNDCTLLDLEHDLIPESVHELVSGAPVLPAIASADELTALDRPAFDDSDQPELATYTPVERPSHKPYTGIAKHTQDTQARYALVWESMRRRPEVDESDQPEQLPLDADSNSAFVRNLPPPALRDKPARLDRYLVELARMSESELAGELKKHRATLKKHSGARWLSDIRARLVLVEREIDARGSPPAAHTRAPSQAPAPFCQQALL